MSQATQPVGADVIARIFGVEVRRIQQLTQEGIITAQKVPGIRARQYDLIPTVQDYIRYLKEKAEGRDSTKTEKDLKKQKLEAEIALKESQTELHQLKTEIAKGKYISTDEAALDYQRFFVTFKKFALAIPSRVAQQISGYVEPVISRSVEKDLNGDITRMLASFVAAGQEQRPPQSGLRPAGSP